jgi:hypothetical protein
MPVIKLHHTTSTGLGNARVVERAMLSIVDG